MWPVRQVRDGASAGDGGTADDKRPLDLGKKGVYSSSIAERKRTMTAKPADKTRRNSILMVLLLGFVIREVVVRALGHTDADGNF
jgi:hypothetical protein